jgi:hypothetical protein
MAISNVIHADISDVTDMAISDGTDVTISEVTDMVISGTKSDRLGEAGALEGAAGPHQQRCVAVSLPRSRCPGRRRGKA